jgi:hypothetical protein
MKKSVWNPPRLPYVSNVGTKTIPSFPRVLIIFVSTFCMLNQNIIRCRQWKSLQIFASLKIIQALVLYILFCVQLLWGDWRRSYWNPDKMWITLRYTCTENNVYGQSRVTYVSQIVDFWWKTRRFVGAEAVSSSFFNFYT